MGFSLTEKLAVAGAFLALTAMAVGTEDDPGVVVTEATKVSVPQPAQRVVPQAAPAAPSQRRWSFLRDGAAEAAAADIRGSAGVDPAPEPGPRNF